MTETAESSVVESRFVHMLHPHTADESDAAASAHAERRLTPSTSDRDTTARRVVQDLESRLTALSQAADTTGLSAHHDPIGTTQGWIKDGLDAIPLPGQGHTRLRWRALAAVGAFDLGVAKLYESHTDALAILAELTPETTPPPGMGAVWAAENGADRLRIDGDVVIGRKPWCSGAAGVDWALVTAWPADATGGPSDARLLVLIDLRHDGISTDSSGWHAVGMADTRTATVTFDSVKATVIGAANAYLDRPGFWHGGAGIAAVWYGAATAIGGRVAMATKSDPYKAMHLGAIDGLLTSAGALLADAARHIDAMPQASSYLWALRTRTVIDDAARRIIDHAARALGAGPLCQEAAFAKRMADLPVFLRQSHAEHDLAALGAHVTASAISGGTPWRL